MTNSIFGHLSDDIYGKLHKKYSQNYQVKEGVKWANYLAPIGKE
jgi:hypothetical protein